MGQDFYDSLLNLTATTTDTLPLTQLVLEVLRLCSFQSLQANLFLSVLWAFDNTFWRDRPLPLLVIDLLIDLNHLLLNKQRHCLVRRSDAEAWHGDPVVE